MILFPKEKGSAVNEYGAAAYLTAGAALRQRSGTVIAAGIVDAPRAGNRPWVGRGNADSPAERLNALPLQQRAPHASADRGNMYVTGRYF